MSLTGSLFRTIIILAGILLSLRSFNPKEVFRTMTIQSERRGDVYFISHGGPPHMFSQESLAHAAWKKVGKYLKETNPRGIVAISAHWEGEGGKGVKVNSNTGNPLIYDFYGFPKHYYDQTFESAGTPALLDDVKSALIGSEIHVEEENRGLDHGVWVPLKIAFGGKTHIPLIQVSLPGDGKVQSSLHLGQALSSLRGYAIVASGQIVHNLRDLFGGAKSFPYLKPFAAATQEAIYSQNPKESITALTKHQNYKQAHPTDEHFYPLPVAIGATDESDTVEEIAFTKEDNLGWGFWRWSRAVDV